MTHRFILQPYRGPASRYHCPQCRHHNKTFTRYIDLENNEHIAGHVGRCDREAKCGYHYTPRRYFTENPYSAGAPQVQVYDAMPVKSLFSHLPASLLRSSMKAYSRNNFIIFLSAIFGRENALQAAERYCIGTSKHWHGATVFWQADAGGCVRTGKIMLYDKKTGKRVKQPFNHVAWAHTLLSRKWGAGSRGPYVTQDFRLKQCFFGEHLLCTDPEATVAITESEKTAVMASIMMPQFIWLAAGALNGLDEDKCQALKNRTILLFPDVGAYGNWKERARTLNLKIPTARFTVHDEMERTATDEERASGADMGDRWVAEWLGC